MDNSSIIDPSLEITDPVPDIYLLFREFNHTFFENSLNSVVVKWNQKMTRSAGMCSFSPRNKDCEISLSEPLLKLRSRKDLVETLLHEMIHAYLFLYDNDTDRNGHGYNFKLWMNNINRLSGTNITIYHDFHDEVNHYRNTWYRCTGTCRNDGPLFGYRKGKTDRGPCKKDAWYAKHKKTCSGVFVKVARGPQKPIGKSKQIKNGKPITTHTEVSGPISDFIPFSGKGIKLSSFLSSSSSSSFISSSNTDSCSIKKPTKSIDSTLLIKSTNQINSESFKEPTNQMDSFPTLKMTNEIDSNPILQPTIQNDEDIEAAIRMSMETDDDDLGAALKMSLESIPAKSNDDVTYVECPCCPQSVPITEINNHLNTCLS